MACTFLTPASFVPFRWDFAGRLQRFRRVAVPLVRRELERLLRVLLPGHVLLRAEGAASAVRPCA